jgi:hypothetical protein
MGLSQPPIQWIPGSLSAGERWLGLEGIHSPLSNTEVNNEENHNAAHPMPPWRVQGLYLYTYIDTLRIYICMYMSV